MTHPLEENNVEKSWWFLADIQTFVLCKAFIRLWHDAEIITVG